MAGRSFVMLPHTLLLLTLSAWLSGGSMHGVVVKKTFKPLPPASSLGVEGIYRLELRDQENNLHRQMVSREIFALYEVGDEFDHGLAPAEILRRKQAPSVQEKEAAKVAAPVRKTKSVTKPKRMVTNKPAVRLFLRQEMLAETEGF